MAISKLARKPRRSGEGRVCEEVNEIRAISAAMRIDNKSDGLSDEEIVEIDFTNLYSRQRPRRRGRRLEQRIFI